jgi:hypothetical protein
VLKNPRVIDWAKESLVRAGAAARSIHGRVYSVEDDRAVRRAVVVVRLIPFEDLSPNAAEFALLETYLSLPNYRECEHSPDSKYRAA